MAQPQSPWILDGSRKAQGSVQECITEVILPLYGATEARFHSAGREDVDVRMVSRRRPPFSSHAAAPFSSHAAFPLCRPLTDGITLRTLTF